MNTHLYVNGVSVTLPDGTEFPFWQGVLCRSATSGRRIEFGTEEEAFRTIQRAAEVVGPAEKILV